MTHIVISGYYGFDNAGDEALLDSITTNLQARWPGIDLTVLSAEPSQTARLHGVQAVQRADFRAIRRVLKQADLLLSGGGSLLQDVTSPYSIPYYLGVAALARTSGARVMFFAQGVGPIRSPWNRSLVRVVGSRVDYITVRDEGSKTLLKELGISGRTPIEVTADAVLALTPGDPYSGRRLIVEAGVNAGDRPLVAVSLREVRGTRTHVGAVIQACRELRSRCGVEFVVVPMQASQDRSISCDFAEGLGGHAHILEGDYWARELGSVFASCELVVGMRLHSLILGALSGTPIAGISYDPKVDGFLASLGMEPLAHVWDESDSELNGNQLSRLLLSTWERRLSFRDQLKARVGELRSSARRNFDIVGSLLELPLHHADS